MMDFKLFQGKTALKVSGVNSRKERGRRFLFGRRIRWIPLLVISLFYVMELSADEIRYDSGGRRDPFIPLVGPGGVVKYGFKSAGQFKVEGIIYDPVEGSYALINGEFLKEGDPVGNAQLISILKDRVVLSVNKDEQVLWLREEVVEE